MSWIKREIHLENGNIAKAQSPYIISASRSTDIPAFYSDWFFHRLEKGYSAWINPFNGEKAMYHIKMSDSLYFGQRTQNHYWNIFTNLTCINPILIAIYNIH